MHRGVSSGNEAMGIWASAIELAVSMDPGGWPMTAEGPHRSEPMSRVGRHLPRNKGVGRVRWQDDSASTAG